MQAIHINTSALESNSDATLAEAIRTGKPLPSLHSPFFRPQPAPTLKAGITALVASILELAPATPPR